MKGVSEIEYSVESDENPMLVCLTGPTAVQLFRIAQEATHNAIKHAEPKRIVVRLAVLDGNIVLTIRDDGVGLRSAAGTSKGMGMTIMHYRARLVDGVLNIGNANDGGVIVTCSVPSALAKDVN